MRREFQRQIVAPWSAATLSSFTQPYHLNESLTKPLVHLVSASTPPLAAAIDLSTTWWSTRLYLLAAIGQKLGDLRRIVVVQKEGDRERFVGMASTSSVRAALSRIHPEAQRFEADFLSRTSGTDVRQMAKNYLEQDWNAAVSPGNESSIALTVNVPNLRLWLGDSFLETPIRIENLESASAIDLLRILDYPNDFVPVVSQTRPGEDPVRLVNKKELSDSLARNSIVEMLDRLGLR